MLCELSRCGVTGADRLRIAALGYPRIRPTAQLHIRGYEDLALDQSCTDCGLRHQWSCTCELSWSSLLSYGRGRTRLERVCAQLSSRKELPVTRKCSSVFRTPARAVLDIRIVCVTPLITRWAYLPGMRKKGTRTSRIGPLSRHARFEAGGGVGPGTS